MADSLIGTKTGNLLIDDKENQIVYFKRLEYLHLQFGWKLIKIPIKHITYRTPFIQLPIELHQSCRLP